MKGTVTSASPPLPYPTPIPSILTLVGLDKVQATSLSPGSASKGPSRQPRPHGWPEVKHLVVAPHYIMTDAMDAWELLSPLKNHSHYIRLH